MPTRDTGLHEQVLSQSVFRPWVSCEEAIAWQMLALKGN